MSRSILEQARRASERLDGATMTPEESALLFQRIDTAVTEPRPRRLLVPSLVAAAATACAALVFALWPAAQDPDPESEPAWYRVTAGANCVSASAADVVAVAGCDRPVVLEVDDSRLTLADSTSVAREEAAIRVHRGEVAFFVQPAVAGDRFEVRVSHGAIITISTLFNVAQGQSSGRVQVESGSIEFHWADGSKPQVVREGESLTWPRAEPEPEIEPEPRAEPPRPKALPKKRKPLAQRPPQPPPRAEPEPQPPKDVVAIMLRLSQLRSQERYQEAFTLLREASQRSDLSATQRERFSFEAGALLEEKLRKPAAACTHWRKHIERFPTGSRAQQVRTRLSSCR